MVSDRVWDKAESQTKNDYFQGIPMRLAQLRPYPVAPDRDVRAPGC